MTSDESLEGGDEPVAAGEAEVADDEPKGLPGVEFFWGLNLFDVETVADETSPDGYHAPEAQIGPRIRGAALGATVYELDPGESICPYHYEVGNEEMLIVLTGKPTLRDENGDDFELKPWDVVGFVQGPEGAHKLTNKSGEPARVVILSTKNEPAYTVYPDSNKVGVWPLGKLYRIDDGVDYWDGEL